MNEVESIAQQICNQSDDTNVSDNLIFYIKFK